jgi:hypothetical protein
MAYLQGRFTSNFNLQFITVGCNSTIFWFPDGSDSLRDSICYSYMTFLGRYAEQSGVEYWVNYWNNGGGQAAYNGSVSNMIQDGAIGSGELGLVNAYGRHSDMTLGSCVDPPEPEAPEGPDLPPNPPEATAGTFGELSGFNYYYSSTYTDSFYTAFPEIEDSMPQYALQASNYFYLFTFQKPGTVPIYRYHNHSGGDHFYTTSSSAPGSYVYEGIVGYAWPSSGPSRVPVYRFWNSGITDHAYLTSSTPPSNPPVSKIVIFAVWGEGYSGGATSTSYYAVFTPTGANASTATAFTVDAGTTQSNFTYYYKQVMPGVTYDVVVYRGRNSGVPTLVQQGLIGPTDGANLWTRTSNIQIVAPGESGKKIFGDQDGTNNDRDDFQITLLIGDGTENGASDTVGGRFYQTTVNYTFGNNRPSFPLTYYLSPEPYVSEGIEWYSPVVVNGCGDPNANNYNPYVNQTPFINCTYSTPDASVSLSPSSICLGNSATLSWSATGYVNSVSIDQGIGSVATSGNRSVSPSSTTTYTLTATGIGGTTTRSVTLDLNFPTTINLTADNSSIIIGQSTYLRWTTTGDAISATLDQGIGAVNNNGNRLISPTTTTTYTINATGVCTNASSTRTITVYQLPTVELSGPVSINYGQQGTLTYSATNADISLRLTPTYAYKNSSVTGTVVNLPTGSSVGPTNTATVIPYNDFGPTSVTYVIVATGNGGQETKQITIPINIDETPDNFLIPDSDDLLEEQAPVSTPDSTITSYQIQIDDIDIPVEVKANKPILTKKNNDDWIKIRQL